MPTGSPSRDPQANPLDGADLIFTTSFGYMDATNNVAAKFKDVKFEHAIGYKRSANVSTYSGRFYEGRTVAGIIADIAARGDAALLDYTARFDRLQAASMSELEVDIRDA